jgi:cytosine/adenosine deaminase-related metal-dependent hydrolase
MRVAFAPFMHDVFDHEFLQIALPPGSAPRSTSAAHRRRAGRAHVPRLASRWLGTGASLCAGPNAFQRCSPDLVRVWRRLANDLGLHAHAHLMETRVQATRGRAVWSGGTVEAMARAGLLTERLSLAHGVCSRREEGEILPSAARPWSTIRPVT